MNYLASPPLCVAYALAGTMDIDLYEDPLGVGSDGQPVYLRDIWPSEQEVHRADRRGRAVGHVPQVLRRGVRRRRALELPRGARRATASRGSDESTYVRKPPYFVDMDRRAAARRGRRGRARPGAARRQRHDRPHLPRRRDQEGLAGRVATSSSTALQPKDFNSYGSRRGNHEVMMRGTFANIRLRNQLAPGTEGGRDDPPGQRRGDADLRRRDALRRGGHAAGRARGQGVRLGLLARLGGQGHEAARRARGDRASPSSGSTAPTSSGWACCRCSSPTANRSSRSA